MIYAVVKDGKVSNLAIATKPINENWISIGSLPVHIKDDYNGEMFYRNGEKVITEEERLRDENEALSEYAEAARILLGEVNV